ncbi:TonB-dependent receptor [Moheibacter stercoris]|uniref:Outer membrane receptor protein involved in Fe transport n=1 Tax=Moheibacter stercoris TaxID=1628251 RepID=A0ABV2LS87_9FLAO
MFRLFLVFILIFSTQILIAQNQLSGIITDETGSPVESVRVSIKNKSTSQSTTSNSSGFYQFTNLPFGDYKLTIRKFDQREEIAISLIQPNQNFDIEFSPISSVNLDAANIVVRSVKSKKEREGFAMNVIETKDAAVRNIQTNELLDRTVGVRIRQNGGLGARVDYNLNGMSGSSVRIFIDGLPISTYGSSFNLNSIPPALIERIEVYKGVVPTHLTDDALGGAINVILKEGARNTLNASVSYGSFNTFQSNLFGTYRSESGFTTKLSGFYNYSDNDYEVWGDHVYTILPNGRQEKIKAKRFNDAYESYGARVELGFTKVDWADNFLITYNNSHDYNEIQHGQFMTKPYKGRYTEADANVVGLVYSKRNFLTKGLDFNFNGVFSDAKELVSDTVKYNYNWDGNIALGLDGNPILTPNGAQQGAPTLNHINRQTISLRTGLDYSFNRNHKISMNAMYFDMDRDQRDDMKPLLERNFLGTRDLSKHISSLAYELRAFDNKFKANLFGKYYIQRIQKMDPVLLINGSGDQIREEIRETSKTEIAGYGMAASYLFGNDIVILASAERAVRMPNETEIFGNPGENILENTSIRPEISKNFNLGFKVGPYKIHNHQVSFSTSGFLRNTQDKIVRKINDRNNDAIQTLPFENLGKTQSVGFEAELGYNYGRNLSVLLSMSRFNSLYKIKYDQHGNQLERYNQQLPNEPFFTANGNVQYSFFNLIQENARLNLNYNFGFVQSFKTTWLKSHSTETPSQFIQDIGLSYIFPNNQFIISFDARNIFNEQAFDNYAVQKPGRAFYLKFNYILNKF